MPEQVRFDVLYGVKTVRPQYVPVSKQLAEVLLRAESIEQERARRRRVAVRKEAAWVIALATLFVLAIAALRLATL